MEVIITGQSLPTAFEDLEAFCQSKGLKITASKGRLHVGGRPRVDVAVNKLLDAYEREKTVRGAARILGLNPGTVWNRLREVGVL